MKEVKKVQDSKDVMENTGNTIKKEEDKWST